MTKEGEGVTDDGGGNRGEGNTTSEGNRQRGGWRGQMTRGVTDNGGGTSSSSGSIGSGSGGADFFFSFIFYLIFVAITQHTT